MAAGFEAGAADGSEAGRRAARLRERALELAERDEQSYAPVLEALRMPAGAPGRAEAVAAALSGAAATPFEIVELAADAARLAAGVAQRAGRHVIGDAAVAAVLSEAACRAAASLVEINLTGAADERPTRAAQLVADAGRARDQVLSIAHES